MNLQQTSGGVNARRAITGWLVRTMRELDGYQAYAARVCYRLLLEDAVFDAVAGQK